MMKHSQHLVTTLLVMGSLLLFHCAGAPKPASQPPAASPGLEGSQNQPATGQLADAEATAGESETLETAETPEELLEEALDAYQEALTAWNKGDAESALAALDEAYGMILRLDVPQDSPHFQGKNDLRLLIAQRIREIYATHLKTAANNHRFIQLVENKYVEREIKSFQTRERQHFLQSYQRSGRYREMIRRELKKAGLPDELCWIPIIESGFKVRAYSRARALGLWQFITSTGYRFGLKKDRWIDERMDPEKATNAAVRYLQELHALFGDWATALAAYNCGEFRVQRVIRAQRINYLDNFWDLYVMLPGETARFVPRFIAALLIIQDPGKYGLELPTPDPPIQYETVTINRPVQLSVLTKHLKLTEGQLAGLNPELRHKATPDREYSLKVPTGWGDKALTAINNLDRWIPPEATYVVHYVRRGETVSGIARRYRTSVSAIARLNRLRRNYLIRPGQRLKVPARGRVGYSTRRYSAVKKPTSRPEGASAYTVQAGDTPYSIAQRFGMRLRSLLSINGLNRRSRIYPGQQLWIIPPN